MCYKKWEIYLAKVRYEDIPGSKVRPVLMLQSGDMVPIDCLKMTGQPPRIGEYSLKEWRKARLKKTNCSQNRQKIKYRFV